MIDEVMLKTLVFISMLNDLARTTKDGFVPLSIFDGTQKGMIYDDQAVAEEFSSSWSTAYPAVAGILSGLRDGEVSYYDELADGEFRIVVEIEDTGKGVPHTFCAVYITAEDTTIDGRQKYYVIHIENGEWEFE